METRGRIILVLCIGLGLSLLCTVPLVVYMVEHGHKRPATCTYTDYNVRVEVCNCKHPYAGYVYYCIQDQCTWIARSCEASQVDAVTQLILHYPINATGPCFRDHDMLYAENSHLSPIFALTWIIVAGGLLLGTVVLTGVLCLHYRRERAYPGSIQFVGLGDGDDAATPVEFD